MRHKHASKGNVISLLLIRMNDLSSDGLRRKWLEVANYLIEKEYNRRSAQLASHNADNKKETQ